jgi:hypothetical protein
VLVPVKIFQFHHMHYESEDAANGLLYVYKNPKDSMLKLFKKCTNISQKNHSPVEEHSKLKKFKILKEEIPFYTFLLF